MSKPAARLGDMHTCPLATPGTPPVPHVGGPITLGAATVLIGSQPAARIGDMATCVGPPDTIALGSATVIIENKPASRMGDQTVHGGVITIGCPTVLIGDSGGGGGGGGGGIGGNVTGGDGDAPAPDPQEIPNAEPAGIPNRPFCEICSSFTDAANAGTPMVECCGS